MTDHQHHLFQRNKIHSLLPIPHRHIFSSIADDDDTSLFLPDLSSPSMTPLDSLTDQDLLLTATNNDECVSLNDQFIIDGQNIRRNDICNPGSTAPAAARKKQPTTVQNLSPGRGAPMYPDFHGPNANPGRWSNNPIDDPFPRPPLDWVNTDFDFTYCPSGKWGWREHAVCDSGIESDRRFDRNFRVMMLCNVSPGTSIIFIGKRGHSFKYFRSYYEIIHARIWN